MTAFLAKSLPIVATQPLFDGRTLNGETHCKLMTLKIQLCPPDPRLKKVQRKGFNVTARHDVDKLIDLLCVTPPAKVDVLRGEFCVWPRGEERELTAPQLVQRLTRVPARVFRSKSTRLHSLVEAGQKLPARPEPWTAPKIFGPDRPAMPFIPTVVTFTGTLKPSKIRILKSGAKVQTRSRITVVGQEPQELRGKTFTHAGGLCMIEKDERYLWETRPSKKSIKEWDAKAAVAMQPKLKSADQLLCIQCGENLIHQFGGFVLCDMCESQPTIFELGDEDWKEQIDGDSHFYDDFQDEQDYNGRERDKVERYERDDQLDEKGYLVSTPISLQEFYRSELYTGRRRMFLDYELAWLLAVKFSGFTERTTPAYIHARSYVAQLAAYFIFRHSFEAIARFVPMSPTDRTTTEDSVRKLCQRAHGYLEAAIKKNGGLMPDEARAALRSGMFNSLYSPTLILGHQCHSETCCTA